MIRSAVPLVPFMALLASCQSVPAPDAARTADTHEAMVRWISPAAQAIWDVANSASAETGGLDPARMDAAAWTRLEDAARVVETRSELMAQAETLHVGAHNDDLAGFATRAEIQAMIDADPNGFRNLSQQMAQHARELVRAAAARDPRASRALAESLTDRCAACHTRYWEKPRR